MHDAIQDDVTNIAYMTTFLARARTLALALPDVTAAVGALQQHNDAVTGPYLLERRGHGRLSILHGWNLGAGA